jgi:uncharacterized protein (UPF0335 family)
MAHSGFAAATLRSFMHRIERMDEEIKAAQDDRKEIFSEAKGTGFDTKIMRIVLRLRKMDKSDRQEQEALIDMYMTAMDAPDDLRAAVREVVLEAGADAHA